MTQPHCAPALPHSSLIGRPGWVEGPAQAFLAAPGWRQEGQILRQDKLALKLCEGKLHTVFSLNTVDCILRNFSMVSVRTWSLVPETWCGMTTQARSMIHAAHPQVAAGAIPPWVLDSVEASSKTNRLCSKHRRFVLAVG